MKENGSKFHFIDKVVRNTILVVERQIPNRTYIFVHQIISKLFSLKKLKYFIFSQSQKLFAFNLSLSSPTLQCSRTLLLLRLLFDIYKENICPVKLLKSSNTIQAFLMFWLVFRLLIWERLVGGVYFWRSLSGNILGPTRVAVGVFLYKHQPVLLFSSTDYLSPTQTRRILIWDKMKRNQRRHFCFLSFY